MKMQAFLPGARVCVQACAESALCLVALSETKTVSIITGSKEKIPSCSLVFYLLIKVMACIECLGFESSSQLTMLKLLFRLFLLHLIM